MGFFSFLGRLLFASLFILSARQMFNDFGTDGGPAAKELISKLNVTNNHLSNFGLGVKLNLDADTVKYVVATSVFLKGFGGFLFVFGSNFGAYLLIIYLAITSPILFDFYNYGKHDPEFIPLLQDFFQHIAFLGALIFFIGMKTTLQRRPLKKKPAPKQKAN
ncbi:hypothetical protein ACFE04_005511 [Oxalis oulophora]